MEKKLRLSKAYPDDRDPKIRFVINAKRRGELLELQRQEIAVRRKRKSSFEATSTPCSSVVRRSQTFKPHWTLFASSSEPLQAQQGTTPEVLNSYVAKYYSPWHGASDQTFQINGSRSPFTVTPYNSPCAGCRYRIRLHAILRDARFLLKLPGLPKRALPRRMEVYPTHPAELLEMTKPLVFSEAARVR